MIHDLGSFWVASTAQRKLVESATPWSSLLITGLNHQRDFPLPCEAKKWTARILDPRCRGAGESPRNYFRVS